MFFDVMLFIFGLIGQFLGMLFTVMLSPTMSLGLFMCILFILIPSLITVFCMIKNQELVSFSSDLRESMRERFDYKGKHSSRGKHEKGGYKGRHRTKDYEPKHEEKYKPKHGHDDD